jgi:signal transduction histidine kinase/tetratricopeptide (TPR) repeat protein
MRKLLIGLVCFAGSIFCQAQSLEIEQLRKQIQEYPQQDTARVNLLIKICFSSPTIPAEELEKYAAEALSLSRKLKYADGEGFALVIESNINGLKRNLEASFAQVEKADSIAKKTNNLELQARVYLGLRLYYYRTNDNRKALTWGLKAEELALQLGNIELVETAQRAIAIIYSNLGNYGQALDYNMKSLKNAEKLNNQTRLYNATNSLAQLYTLIGEYEKSNEYLLKLIDLHNQLKLGNTELSNLYNGLGENYRLNKKYPEAIVEYNRAINIAASEEESIVFLSNIADVYLRMDSLNLALQYGYESQSLAKKSGDNSIDAWIFGILARAHVKQSNPDSAIFYAEKGYALGVQTGYMEDMRDNSGVLSEAYALKNDYRKAYDYYKTYISYLDSMTTAEVQNKATMMEYNFEMEKKEDEISLLNEQKTAQKNFLISALVVLGLILITVFLLLRNNRLKQKANLLLQQQKLEIDEKASQLAIQKESLEKSYQNVELLGEIGRKITSSLSVDQIIGTIYQNVNGLMDASVFGIGIYHETSRSLDFPATFENGQALPPYSNSLADQNRLAAICFNSQEEIVINDVRQEYGKYLQQMPKATEGQVPTSLIYLPLIVKDRRFGVLTVQSFRPNAFSDYHLYMLRTVALYAGIALENAESFDQLSEALNSLQETQAQLIQSEKMASLGELTAGIAHEIKNPLNFVNNFADLSIELVEEMKEELENGNTEEALSLASDIKDNLAKIHQHGGRADRIVKSMLLHSRGGSGQMEPTDINGKIREFSNLAFHGMRAGNKAINVEINLNLDEKIGEIPLFTDDFNRVILNLCNNAFDAMREKGEEASSKSAGYKPLLTISSKKLEKGVGLIFEDNGPGIPEEIKDKILQPFFTTKKGTEGTGLGLSITHDIIKRHNGNLEIYSKEGEQTQFIIFLPTLN